MPVKAHAKPKRNFKHKILLWENSFSHLQKLSTDFPQCKPNYEVILKCILSLAAFITEHCKGNLVKS